jgi:hypothetical protein
MAMLDHVKQASFDTGVAAANVGVLVWLQYTVTLLNLLAAVLALLLALWRYWDYRRERKRKR